MTKARPSSPAGKAPQRGGPPRAIGEVLPAAMRGMGLPSRAVVHRVVAAWSEVVGPAWASRTTPLSLANGTLFIGVPSAPLRDELARFHAERLLAELSARLPLDRVAALRFVATAEEAR